MKPLGSQLRLGIRGLVLAGMLVPVLGLGALALGNVQERRDHQEAAAELRAASEELRVAVGYRATFAKAEIHATALGLARDFGLDGAEVEAVSAGEISADLRIAWTRIDAGRRALPAPQIDRAANRLERLNDELRGGLAGRSEVATAFRAINAELAAHQASQMRRIEAVADQRPLDRDLRARLRTLRESLAAFEQGAERINATLEILLEQPSAGALEHLVAADTRFQAAVSRVGAADGTLAAEAWTAFRDDPAAQRTEDVIATARQVGLGELAPWASPDLAPLISGLADGERWGDLLVEIVEAAATDLSLAAGDRAEVASAAVRTEILRTAVLAALSVVVALLTARELVRPAVDLERAARAVEQGTFDIAPVPVRGPREVTATVVAFNDMAATLAAIEDHAVALAEDPGAALLDQPLPGRTGRAMQVALDRLRGSISEADEHRAELYVLATHDGLTGLLNRAAAFAAIKRDLARARRDRTQLLAFYVDLDGLKQLNDTYGHEVGDQAIVRTADALRSTTRNSDVVARLGGDEFIVVGPVPDGGAEEITAFAERVRSAVALQSVQVEDRAVPLQCSIGVALSGPGTDSAEGLVRAADSAMYLAKHSGRDRVAWSAAEPQPPVGA